MQSPALISSDMPESQTALEPVSIFALDKYKPFAATPVETWRTLQSMFADINAFEERSKREIKLDRITDEDGEELYRKHPFLEFTRQQPGLGDPCGELAVRTEVWDEAHCHLGYTPPEEIKQYKEALWRFYEKYSDDDYILFLWQQPSHTLEQISSLLLYAYDEIWAFTQKLKVKELTPLQNQDRQKLKLWIVGKVRHLLLQEELTAIYDSKGLDDRTVSHVEIKEAERNVAKKTAKGVWRPLGLQKLNFEWNLD